MSDKVTAHRLVSYSKPDLLFLVLMLGLVVSPLLLHEQNESTRHKTACPSALLDSVVCTSLGPQPALPAKDLPNAWR